MYDTHCIYCGTRMIWGINFSYEELFHPFDDKDRERIVTEVSCPKCGATAMFVQPRDE